MKSKCLLSYKFYHIKIFNYSNFLIYDYVRHKNTHEEASNRLSNMDRLRFIEAMVSDPVLDTYRLSQNALTRKELDARNSCERDLTFFEKVSNQFNDNEFKPFTTSYPSLHPDFVDQILLEKGEYDMTPIKAKEIIGNVRPLITKMIINYEESGQGSMSKHDDAADWGSFDIELCDGNDDRSRFLLNPSQTYLLYWWAKLDEYNLVAFTCAQIPSHLTANTENSPKVSPNKFNRTHKKAHSNEINSKMNDNVAAIGKSMSDLVDVETESQIIRLQDNALDLELKICDLDDEKDAKVISVIRKRLLQIDTKVKSLEERIAKKSKKE